MSKFKGLAIDVTLPYRVVLKHAATGEPIADASGRVAYVDTLSTDSEPARAFEREQAKKPAGALLAGQEPDVDPFEQNGAKTARLIVGWHLVDPSTREVIDVPCTPENARDLCTDPATAWVFRQVWLGALNAGNFFGLAPTS